jgi:hypothetical protein
VDLHVEAESYLLCIPFEIVYSSHLFFGLSWISSEETWQFGIENPWLSAFCLPLPLACVSSHLQSFKDSNTPQRVMGRLAFWSLGTGGEEGLSTNHKLLIRF